MDWCQSSGLVKHRHCGGGDMQSGEDFGQPFVVFCKPAAARHPGKRPLDQPAARQRHEAALGVGQLTPSKLMPCLAAAASARSLA